MTDIKNAEKAPAASPAGRTKATPSRGSAHNHRTTVIVVSVALILAVETTMTVVR